MIKASKKLSIAHLEEGSHNAYLTAKITHSDAFSFAKLDKEALHFAIMFGPGLRVREQKETAFQSSLIHGWMENSHPECSTEQSSFY